MVSTGDYVGEVPPEQRRLNELQARRAAEKKAYKKWYDSTAKGREVRNRGKRNHRMNKRLSYGFVGVDGEGSESAYLLLRAGERYLHTGRPLTFRQCMSFLCELPRDPTYVAFFFDYDVTMMLRKLPEERLRRLLTPALRTGSKGLMPIDCEGFQFDYRPGKEFKVRRKGEVKWLTINDVGSFFQCSFVKALQSWGVGSPEELEKVKSGKQMRSGFTVMDAQVIEYNGIECELLAQLMTKFGAACRGIGYLPRKWQGPGELASAMMFHHDIPKRKELTNVPLDLWEAANKSYYGGRFETSVIGHVSRPLYQYDINSAYPDVIRRLPCLLHGEWELASAPADCEFSLIFGSFYPNLQEKLDLTAGKGSLLYGLPIRQEDGQIVYPREGRGWYWKHEIDEAKHQTFKPEIAWNYVKKCNCKPFDWVEPLYVKRKEWERQTENPTASNMGIALKLALNSIYGKLAQSIGMAPYANPIWASLITSLTRTKLYGMVHVLSDCANRSRCGQPVYYLATDGLFASTEVSDGVGTALGEWGRDEISEDLLFVQPGIYIGSEDARMKTRGIPKAKMELFADEFRWAWEFLLEVKNPKKREAMVTIPFHQFLGLKQALAFNRLADAGTWEDLPRQYSFEWMGKRDMNVTEKGAGHHRTIPQKGSRLRESRGYDKDIGKWLDENRPWYDKRVWYEAQPEDATTSVDLGFTINWETA